MNVSKSSNNKLYNATKFEDIDFKRIECLLYFDKNYTVALRRRIERRIKNKVDFENSQIIITMSITGIFQYLF